MGGTIHRTLRLLQDALEQLGVEVVPEAKTNSSDGDMATIGILELERIGVIIHNAMNVQERSFHTPEHIFDLTDPAKPHSTLAALFHDIVYFHVDQGFIPEIEFVLTPFISVRGGSIRLTSDPEPTVDEGRNRVFAGCLAVFGFEPGQELSPFGGMNEFLSALVMDLLFEGVLSDRDLLAATVAIEATIPFRKPDENGDTPPRIMERRILRINDAFRLGLGEEDVFDAVKSAVSFANRDVNNFAEEDIGRFLDNTWKLLPETNPSLRHRGVYSIGSYRTALQKMEGFLGFLDPATIFVQYRDTPPEGEYRRMLELAERNVATARDYLGIKLLTAVILEALALVSGGDAPVSLFMGDLGAEEEGDRLTDFLPELESAPEIPMDPILHDLLAYGRASSSTFDLQNSPLSLFIYRRTGSEGFHECLAEAKKMTSGELTPEAFLKELPGGLAAGIAHACEEMAFTRRDAFKRLFPY